MRVPENPYRSLPKVDELADDYEGNLPRQVAVDVIRAVLDEARDSIGEGETPDAEEMIRDALRALERSAGSRVVNATGVLLHTNLGRAPWSADAVARAEMAATHYTNLEIDIDTGDRSKRGGYVRHLMSALTGAEDCLVVNNNAAAVMLALAATSSGRSVPVARGELIEIGGSYRLPEVMEASGANLVEVGTTNRTRAGDYETALQVNRCGAILRVHPSNYRVDGFVETPEVEDLARIAKETGVPLIFDIGSGLLDADTPWIDGTRPDWLKDEPAVRQALEAGADIVTFSGDKLLGGPQAGIIVGRAEVVNRLRTHAMARALRVDGVTYGALIATLDAYTSDVRSIPFWQMALQSTEGLETRIQSVATTTGGTIEKGSSTVGAGSIPGSRIPSPILRLPGQDRIYACLLGGAVPILTRRDSGDLLIDLRAVAADDDTLIAEAVAECL